MADKNKMRILAWVISAGLIVGSIPAGTPAFAAATQGSTETAAEESSPDFSGDQDETPDENSAEKTVGQEAAEAPSSDVDTEEEAAEASSSDADTEEEAAEAPSSGADTEEEAAEAPSSDAESIRNAEKEDDAAREDGSATGNDASHAPVAEETERTGPEKTAEDEGEGLEKTVTEDAGEETEETTAEENGSGETAPGSVRFLIKGSGEELGGEDISFDKDSTGFEAGEFQFGDSSVGDRIKYTVKKDGYKEAKGEFTLEESSQSIEVDLEEKKEETVELSAVYGDDPVDLSKELEGAGHGNAKSYSIENGDDVISISDSGMAEIKKAGSASIIAEIEDGTVTFKVTVSKLDLGELSSDDIDWEGTEREEDETKAFSLSGTVKGSAGLINNDSVTVTADGQAKSEKPGTWATSLSNIKFQGADNYTLTLSKTGPEVTITKKKEEIAVAGTYSGSPQNGKYFNGKRTLTVKVTGDDFNESALMFHLSVDGEAKDYTVSKLNAGNVKSVSLEKEGDRTYILTFGKEGEEHEYSASVTYDDKTAKLSGAAKDSFVVDMAVPELVVSFTDKNGKAVMPEEGNAVTSYIQGGVTAALSVKDGSFDKKNVKVTVNATDGEGKPVSVYSGADGPSTGSWQGAEKDHAFTMDEFTEDANYVLSVSVEDLAGNKTEYAPHAFGIDKDAPEAELVVNAGKEKKYTEYSEETSFGIAGRKDVRFTASASDTSSGVDRIQYCVETPKSLEDGKAAAVSMEKLPSLAWKDMPEDGVELMADSISVVYLKVTDKAGNTAYLDTKDIIIADATKPEIRIEEKGAREQIYAGDISLRVNAEDIISQDIYSGLSELKVEIESNGKVTDTYRYTPGFLPERIQEFTADITVDAGKNNSNSVIVRAMAKDAAGNSAETEKEFSIDTKTPEIEAKVTNSGIRNGHYLNETAEIEAVFRERDFTPDKALFSFSTGGEEYTFTMEELSEGKGRTAQVLVKNVEDSQKDVPYKDRTDSREIKYTLQLGIDAGADMTYDEMRFACTDPAGNEGKGVAEPLVLTIDKIAPAIAISYSDDGTDVTGKVTVSEDSPLFTQGSITAELTVKDTNFAPGAVTVTITSKDSTGKDTDSYSPVNMSEGWLEDRGAHIKQLPVFTKDSNFSISMEIEDLAGNKAPIYPAHYFTIDKTAPSGKLTVHSKDNNRSYTGFSPNAAFSSVSNKTITVTHSVSDKTSGVANVMYYRYTPPAGASGRFTSLSLNALRNASWEDWDGELKVEPDSQAIIYARIADRAGNILYISTKGAMIADKTKPWAPQIKLSGTKPENGIYAGNVPLTVSVSDKEKGGTYSGLKDVIIEVLNNGKVTQNAEYHPGSKAERIRSMSAALMIDASKNNSNNVMIRVTANDHAGNTASSEEKIAIDVTRPVIEVTYDNNDPANGKYYNKPRTATVTIKERNFDPSRVSLALQNGAKASSWSIGSGAGSSDGARNSCTVMFGADGDYAFTLSVKDKAGNNASYGKTDMFTVDMTAPVIAASYNAGGKDITGRIGTSKNAPFYTQDDITAEFTVRDKNFAPKTVNLTVTSKDSSGKDTGSYSPGNMSSGWAEDGDRHIKKLPVFTNDANYSISMEIEDLAGNKATVYPAHYFTIDKTAPRGKLTVHSKDGDKSYTGFTENASFDSVSGETITVTRSASDKTSGIASVMYYRYTPPAGASGRFTSLSLNALRNASWEDWDGELKVEPDSQAIIYARIADRAGNILYISTKGAMIADKTEPWDPEFKFFNTNLENGIFAGNTPLTVSVSDKEKGGTYSGLKDVIIEVLNNGKVTQNAEYHPGSKAERIRSMGTTIMIDASKNNSNNVIIRVTARDYAGNVASSEKHMAIDITDPVIEVTYDNNSPINGKYYNKPRTATVTIKERNFVPSQVNLSLQNGAKASGWSIGSGAGSSDDARNSCTIKFGADGDYAFTLSVKDKAGNNASYGKTDMFTVDMTDPVIHVVYNADRESGFYNVARTATIHVMEHNFRPQEFEAQVKATLEGMGITAPSVSSWGGTGDDHTATLTFAKDGNYSFSLDYTDLAANKAKEFSQGTFTIDMTAPGLEIAGVKDGSANRGKVTPVIRYTDLNFTDNLALKLSGTRHKERDVTGAFRRLENGGEIIVNDFLYDITEDDVYTLTARSVDKAGNVSKKTLHFSVNRFGSNFYLDDKTKEDLKPYYIQHADNVIIYEINVDKVTERTFTVYRDSTAVSIPEGAIRIEEQDDGNGWIKYCYIINKSALEEEGLYEIVVSTMDAAGNRQENRIKNVPITFAIDRTPPSATITGIEDGKTYYSTDRDMEIRAMDDRALTKVEILVNGEIVEACDSKVLEKMNGIIPFKITESDAWKTVSAIAYDAAGNVSVESPVKVMVTTNRMTQFMNSPAPLISGCALAGFAALAAFLAKKLSDRDEDERLNDTDDEHYE